MREIIYEHIYNGNDVYMDCLTAILGETARHSMIDLGCHKAAHTPLFKFKKRRYVDVLPNVLDYPEEQKYFVQDDILNTPLDVKYDVSFAQDVIEHLTIEDGIKLLNIMNTISDKQILFTPLDDLFGFAELHDSNPEAHRSLWKPYMIEGFIPNKYIFITFPNYHSVWNGGAFFFYSCVGDIDKEYVRIQKELDKCAWVK